jgi:hypothetical protein
LFFWDIERGNARGKLGPSEPDDRFTAGSISNGRQ